jgi:predicted lipoprotein with Yx(FWY)xxD motif
MPSNPKEVYPMKRSLVQAAAIVGAVVTVAGCGGTGGDTGAASGGGTTAGDPIVSAKQVAGAGSVLVDASGRALYDNDQEARGAVLCKGSCLSFWMPLTMTGTPTGGSLGGKLGAVVRPDGTRQATYNGKLLYSFSLDSPGKVSGDGFADAFGGQKFTWHVVRSDTTAAAAGGASAPATTARGY